MSEPQPLPPRPDLHWLKNRAKERLAALRGRDPSAQLAESQRDVARTYGFPSWRALKAHVDAVRAAADADADAPAGTPPAADAAPNPERDDAFRDQVVGAFLLAVGTGQIDAVRSALEKVPALVNAVGPHPFWGGRPQALHVAIESDRRELFDLLLEQGANVNGANAEYMLWSPLMLTVHWKRDAMKQVLLARGARIGLAEALSLGDDEALDVILERDGEQAVSGPAPNNGTFLHLAHTPHAIDRLLAFGVALDRKDYWGATAIEALSRQGPAGAPLVAHLVARGAVATPAELARTGDRAALERLFAADPAAVLAPATFKAAVDFGHHDLVRRLLALGSDVNGRAADQSQQTPLHSAAWNGDLPMVRLLVEAGADVFARDRQYDGAPLGWAETAIEVTNNPRCADVAAYLRSVCDTSPGPPYTPQS